MDDFDKVFLCQSSNSQGPTVEPISICKCLFPESAEESLINSERKNKLLSRVANTETYLRERRIPELIRFILTKILANRSKHPLDFAWKLLDDCMLYRAGIGQAPVLYEERYLIFIFIETIAYHFNKNLDTHLYIPTVKGVKGLDY